jgi:hypothetical protein
MKLKITLKDPDGINASIWEAVANDSVEIGGAQERVEIMQVRCRQLKQQCKPWIQFGEFVTIEIDTDAGAATVCKVER